MAMTRFLDNPARGLLLGLCLFMNVPGKQGNIPVHRKTVLPADKVASPAWPHSASDHRVLPRYYLSSYSIKDSSEGKEFAKQRFIAILRQWLPVERILDRVPGDCVRESPCDEINLLEEQVGERRQLKMQLTPRPASSLGHEPIVSATRPKSSWGTTIDCLFKDISGKLQAHDKVHQTEKQ